MSGSKQTLSQPNKFQQCTSNSHFQPTTLPTNSTKQGAFTSAAPTLASTKESATVKPNSSNSVYTRRHTWYSPSVGGIQRKTTITTPHCSFTAPPPMQQLGPKSMPSFSTAKHPLSDAKKACCVCQPLFHVVLISGRDAFLTYLHSDQNSLLLYPNFSGCFR